jgi:hypothetical protein
MLRYTGKGALAGIPARDLTDEEVEKAHAALLVLGLTEKQIKEQGGVADALIKTGLYEKGRARAAAEDKSRSGPVDNKDGE